MRTKRQRSPGFAPKQVWPCALHCLLSHACLHASYILTLSALHGMRLTCRAATMGCWVPHKLWKHSNLVTRTHTKGSSIHTTENFFRQFNTSHGRVHLSIHFEIRQFFVGQEAPSVWQSHAAVPIPLHGWFRDSLGGFCAEESQAEIFQWQEGREFAGQWGKTACHYYYQMTTTVVMCCQS